MKIGEFGLIVPTGAPIESTKLTAASNRFQAFFHSVAKSDTISVQLPESESKTVFSKAALQNLLNVLTNDDVTKLESFSSTADSAGEKMDPINILHTLLNNWDIDSNLNENTLHQMAEKVEQAFSKVEKQLVDFIQSFSFDVPTENMFAETPLPKLMNALKGIQLAGKETALLQNEQKVNETVNALTNLVSRLIDQTSIVIESNGNNSNTDTEDSLIEKTPIMQESNQSNKNGYRYINQKTDDMISNKEDGPIIDTTNAKVHPEISSNIAYETNKNTAQTVASKANDATVSNGLPNKMEQNDLKTTATALIDKKQSLKNGEFISSDRLENKLFLESNEELIVGEALSASQKNISKKAINALNEGNNEIASKNETGKLEATRDMAIEAAPNKQFETDKVSILNAELSSIAQMENRFIQARSTAETIKKSADANIANAPNKKGNLIQSDIAKESGAKMNSISTDFLEEKALQQNSGQIGREAEQVANALNPSISVFRDNQEPTQMDQNRVKSNSHPLTMSMSSELAEVRVGDGESVPFLEWTGKKQPGIKDQVEAFMEGPNQEKAGNISNLFTTTFSKEAEKIQETVNLKGNGQVNRLNQTTRPVQGTSEKVEEAQTTPFSASTSLEEAEKIPAALTHEGNGQVNGLTQTTGSVQGTREKVKESQATLFSATTSLEEAEKAPAALNLEGNGQVNGLTQTTRSVQGTRGKVEESRSTSFSATTSLEEAEKAQTALNLERNGQVNGLTQTTRSVQGISGKVEESRSTPFSATNSLEQAEKVQAVLNLEGNGQANGRKQIPRFVQGTSEKIEEAPATSFSATTSLEEVGKVQAALNLEGNGQIIRFSQAASQLVQKNPDYTRNLDELGQDQSARMIETNERMKEQTSTSNSSTRINPLFGQLQQINEDNSLNRLRNQPINANLALQATVGNISNETNLLQEVSTTSSEVIGKTNVIGVTESMDKEMPIHPNKNIEESAIVGLDVQSKQKDATPRYQTKTLDTVKLINPLFYQTPSQTAEVSIKGLNQDAILANGILASAAVVMDETATKLGRTVNNGQLINPFPYKTFLGRTDSQTKSSSQGANLTEAEEAQFPLNNIKSLVSSIVDKLSTPTKKEEKTNLMFAKMVNPLMIGSIKNTNDLESTRTESIKPLVENNETEAKATAVGQMQTVFSTKQEPLVLLTASGNSVSAHQLREQLEKVLANGKYVNNGDKQTFTIRLAPDHLGSIKIEIYQNEGNISAKILTASQEAKEVLETHLTSIKHSFSSQNAVVDKLDIAYTPSQQDKTTKDNQQQQQQQQQQQKEQQSSQQKEQEKQRKTFLEELLNME